MPLTEEEQKEIDEALEKEVNDLDDFVEESNAEDNNEETNTESETNDGESEDKGESETSGTEGDASGTETEVSKPEGEVVTKTEKVETKSQTDTQEDIVTELRDQINNLNKTILDLKSKKPEETKVEPTVEETDKTKTEESHIEIKPTEEPEKFESVDYIGDTDMDDVSADKEVLNKIINAAVENAVKIAKSQTLNLKTDLVKETLLEIPQAIQAQIQQQSFINTTVKEFYDINKDLAPVKETVAQVAQGIAAEHPDYNIEQLFTEAAKVTRQILKMPETGTVNKDNKEEFSNPAFAANTSRRQKPEKVSDLQMEIDEL